MNRVHPLLLLTLGLSLLSVGCNKATAASVPAAARAVPAAEAVVTVHAAKAQTQRLPAILELSGTLAADESSDVAAPTMGIATEVLVDVGSRVKKGDVLARIDRRDAAMRVLQATAATGQASARLGIKAGGAFNAQRVPEVQVARQAMELAETEGKRAKALYEGGSAAQSVWEQARVRTEQARGQYEAAVNGAHQSWSALQAARATQDLTEKAAADTDVRAPFDGVVTEKRIAPGEFCQMGRVVAVVVRTDPLRLKFDVPEVDAAKVQENAEVTIAVAAWPGRVFPGTVKRIGGALKAQARALPVEAEVANTKGELKPGFFARIALSVEGDGIDAVLVAPAAIGSSGSASRVFVVEGGRAVERIVAVGRSWQGLVEVRGAVHAGDLVAVDQVDKLTDGVRVAVAQ